MHIDELDTPAVICDLEKIDRNIREMAKHCRKLEIPLRCHSKAHKIPEIAHQQLNSGAIGICCQKTTEAEVMVAAGIRDIFLPFNIVGPKKAARLMRLARRASISAAVDSVETAQGLSNEAGRTGGSVSVLIELETGYVRCGMQNPKAARDLGRQIVDLHGVDLHGVMIYPSQEEAKPFLDETLELFRKDGLPTEVISGGGTGSEAASKSLGCTETRSGSYLWKGIAYPKSIDEIDKTNWPLRIITTVVSKPEPGRIIVDGGLKTFTGYPAFPNCRCLEDPAIIMDRMSVEHGHCDVSHSSRKFQIGDRLTFLPLHPEMALNLHDELAGYRDGQVEVIWPVAARGKVR